MAFLSAAGLPPLRRLCCSALLLQLLLCLISPPQAVSAVHTIKAAVTVAKPPPPKKSPPPARKPPPPPLRSAPVRSPPVLKSPPPPPPLRSPPPLSTARPPPQSPAASPPVRAPPPPPLQYTVAFTDFALITPLVLSGAARQVSGNTLQLTQSAAKLAGAALLRTAVPLTVTTPSSACAALPFSTSFSFQIVSRGADGLALVLSPAASNLGSPGGNLGWGGPRAPRSAGDGPSVAFEFDTFQDRWDRSANHVGVNVNYSMASVAAANVTGTLLGDGGRKYAWVDFDGAAVSIYVSTATTKPAAAVLTAALDLCRIFGGRPRNVFVGFSASTGNVTAQAHSVLSWFWNTVPLGSPPPPSPPALPPAPSTPPPPPYLGPPVGFDARGPFLQPTGLLTTFRHSSTYFTGNARSSSWQPPPSVDWRNKSGVLPPVQDMGLCGGSWAFAAAAAIDSAWAITFKQPAPGVSQQQLIDCANPTQDSCAAGHPGDALEYVSRLWSTSRGGLVSSTFYPFSGMQSPSCDKAKANQGQYSVVAYEQVQSFGWLGLALAVAAQPVVVNVVGSWPSFYTYRGGFVYDDEGCFSSGLVDHSVLLVGYSLDTTAGRVPYWIIRNSWGTGWGDNGYGLIKIVGGDGICGIQSTPGLYPIIAGLASPCDSGINPCGSGVCSPSEDGTTNECACPDQFIPVVADLDTGSQTCAPVRVCSYSLYNPCGTGTCLDDGIGGYRCICPAGSTSALLATGLPTCIPGDTEMMYAVREGDTCYFIATSYGLTDEQLELQNPGLSCARLLPEGQILNVTSTVASKCGLLYSVNPGDSCAAIFSLFKMTASQFRSLNPGVSCFPTDTKPGLVPGQQVCVSNVTGAKLECNGTVVLRPGDTCASLRDAYGLDALSFYRLNPGINCANLLGLFGQEVCIKGVPNVGAQRCIVPLYYAVKLGDTCQTILAARFRNNPRLMLRLNPGFVCIQQRLFIGKILCLPWW